MSRATLKHAITIEAAIRTVKSDRMWAIMKIDCFIFGLFELLSTNSKQNISILCFNKKVIISVIYEGIFRKDRLEITAILFNFYSVILDIK